MSASQTTLRLGTRGSRLALAQSNAVGRQLETNVEGLRVEVVVCRTTGDRVQDRPLQELGGKGLFVKEIEEALLDRRIDLAVHSLKDVPVTEPLIDVSELILAAIPKRENALDVLISRSRSIADLPRGAHVGTCSLRRKAQLLALRDDLQIEPLRGNIDTRLSRVEHGDFDATILAMAGLKRADLLNESWMTPIDMTQILPAPGQGALALQCRREDSEIIDHLGHLDDAQTRRCVELERGVIAALNGDCHSPIGAYAAEKEGMVFLSICVGRRDGSTPVLRVTGNSQVSQGRQLLGNLIDELRTQNVDKLLA